MGIGMRVAHLEDGVRTIVPAGRDGLFHHFDRSVRDSCRQLEVSDRTGRDDETTDEVAARQSANDCRRLERCMLKSN